MTEDQPTKWCLQCGGEFIAELDECPDCGLALVDDKPDDHLAPDLTAEGQTQYDLADWAAESRLMVQQLMQAEAVPHAWQGTTLIVPRAFEARSDLVIDHVDATTLPTLDKDAELVAYELDEWADDQIDELVAILDMEGIAYEFDEEGDLVVEATDDPRVEAIIETMNTVGEAAAPTAGTAATGDDAQEDAEGDDDGEDDEDDEDDDDDDYDIDTGRLLSDLFVASDRLMHRARDHEGVLSLVDNAEYARVTPLPYGFVPAVWSDIVSLIDSVCDLLEDDDSTDEQIEEAAKRLRDVLRQYV